MASGRDKTKSTRRPSRPTQRWRGRTGRVEFAVRCCLVAVLLSSCASRAPRAPEAPAVASRTFRRDLQAAMTGALLWLEDNQVRDRAGRQSSLRDLAAGDDACDPVVKANLPLARDIEIPAPPWADITNLAGEWASEVHFYPRRCTLNDLSLIALQDSNLFSTAFTALPLCLVDDGGLPSRKRFVTRMLEDAASNLPRFRRAAGYGFWPELPGVESSARRRGPPNIPIPFLRATALAALSRDASDFFKTSPSVPKTRFGQWMLWLIVHPGYRTRDDVPPKRWLTDCLDQSINPAGADALFNIPDDADDTAAAVILRHSIAVRAGSAPPDASVLTALSRHRDLNRSRTDERNTWKPDHSGAFLTWLTSESDRPFDSPHEGVMPLGTNNVDPVVNANAVHALALTSRKDQPGYREAVKLLADLASSGQWQGASLYYPQPMMFPYAISRAFRDGGADDAVLRRALRVLAADLLRIHEDWSRRHPSRAGGFPGGEDRSEALATALGLNALLNIGPGIMREVGVEARFRRAVEQSVAHLLKLRREGKARDASTRALAGRSRARTCSWPGGVFFASSFTDLAHWRSEAHTTAVAFEALARYALGYDERDGGTGRLALVEDSRMPGGFALSAR